jgi:hypothetical protein
MAVDTYTSTGTWLCPYGVTSVQVESWGAGGGGAGEDGTDAGGGGAGGAYSKTNAITVIPGNSYTVTVGSGGAGGLDGSPGSNGGDSGFDDNSENLAKGGQGGQLEQTTSSGGAAASGVGDTKYSGGDGGADGGDNGGGGGGGAGDAGNGSNGATGNGGSAAGGAAGAGSGGGAGGAGSADTPDDGSPGNTYGGGGGGAGDDGADNTNGVGAGGQVIITYTTGLIELLTDNFDDNSLDTGKWAETETGTATVTEQNQNQEYDLPAAADSGDYAEIVSVKYDLTSSYIFIEITEVPAAGTNADADFRAYIDTDNWFRWVYEAGTIYAQRRKAAAQATIYSVAFNAVTHRWWRIRESGGDIYWDTSEDGITWTNRGTYTHGMTITSTKALLACYCYQNETDPGGWNIDNFNIVQTAGIESDRLLIGVGQSTRV